MNGARTADDATGYAMSLMTATVSADTYMKAWASKSWISNLKDMPPAPYSMMDMYLVHQAMQDHALAVEAFGGIAGYKLGAVGVIPVGTHFPLLQCVVRILRARWHDFSGRDCCICAALQTVYCKCARGRSVGGGDKHAHSRGRGRSYNGTRSPSEAGWQLLYCPRGMAGCRKCDACNRNVRPSINCRMHCCSGSLCPLLSPSLPISLSLSFSHAKAATYPLSDGVAYSVA